MISVTEAKELVLSNTELMVKTIKPLIEAAGSVLAEDVYAEIDIPPFDQSAMDGYAFCFDDLNKKSILSIKGVVAAGEQASFPLKPFEAMRIFTGAAIPEGADTVVMQEKVKIKDKDTIEVEDDQLNRGSNIRLKGSQNKKGELALKAGNKLNPASIGYLAGLGLTEIKLYKKPSISLIITGKELQTPGKTLSPGMIYESNSYSLRAALKQLLIDPVSIQIVEDDEAVISQHIKNELNNSDMLILTGGVSVGDYDFVTGAARSAGVETIFHKVKQKPGKPVFFGKAGKKLIFGLPGNPASVLTCFYEYVLPAIQKMMGFKEPFIRKTQLKLALGYQKKPGLTHFIKAQILNGEVIPLKAQESYQMGSFAASDAFIVLEENKTDFQKGELVEVHIFSV